MKRIFLPLRFGILMSSLLIGYFLLLSTINLHTQPAFSLFNAVIVGAGIFYAVKFRKQNLDSTFNYSIGFSTGILSGFISTIIFTAFMLLYVTEINSNFIHALLTSWDNHININVGSFIFVVALMGFSTTVVLSLTVMQYFKKPLLYRNTLIHE